jgi:hypothetical protein
VERGGRRSRVCLSRVRESFLGAYRDERVQLGVEPLDAFEVEPDELGGRELALADEAGLLERREEGELLARASAGWLAQIQSYLSWTMGMRKYSTDVQSRAT